MSNLENTIESGSTEREEKGNLTVVWVGGFPGEGLRHGDGRTAGKKGQSLRLVTRIEKGKHSRKEEPANNAVLKSSGEENVVRIKIGRESLRSFPRDG